MKIKNCIDCKSKITEAHANRKRCITCVEILKKRPKGTMTYDQIKLAKMLAGTMPRDEIAKKLGVSLSNLKRSCPEIKFTYHNRWVNNPTLVKEICRYYEKYGKTKTQEKYPEIKIRSIIEHYKFYKPRTIPWKDNELIELAKFAGLIPLKDQAKFFNRPNANAGSIKSAWYKRFKTTPCYMHGMPVHKAKIFLQPNFPTIKVKRQISGSPTKLVLFCDAINFLRDDCPEFIKEAIIAISDFQKSLFGENPRHEIENIVMAFA